MEKIKLEKVYKKSILSEFLKQESLDKNAEKRKYSREFLLSLRDVSNVNCAEITKNLEIFRSEKMSKSFEIPKNFKFSLKELNLNSPASVDDYTGDFSSLDNQWRESVGKDGCTIVKIKRFSQVANDYISVPKRHWKKNLDKDSRHFLVLCWNLLAPLYAKEEKFYLTELKDLDWENRKKKILDEIIYYSPDFICLQVCHS